MHKYTKQFVEYCLSKFDLNESEVYRYKSLSVCVIDCIYSLRTQYYSVTIPVVDRYAACYMDNDKYGEGDTLSMLLERIDSVGGPEVFAKEVLKNNQKTGNVLKASACYQTAQYLHYLHIDTLEDFQRFESPELLEIVLRAVKGLGDAGLNYLFMLAGDSNRCKPDVHIHHCITDACGYDISNEECQELFKDAVQCLREQYQSLTVRSLDGIIWRAYQGEKNKSIR